MQNIELKKQVREDYKYFEPSDEEDMVIVYHRYLEKSIMMFRTRCLGKYSKSDAIKLIYDEYIEPPKNDLVGCDLSSVDDFSEENICSEEVNTVNEAVSEVSVNVSAEEEVKEDEKSLDWTFLEDEPEIEEPGVRYTHVTDGQYSHVGNVRASKCLGRGIL